MERKREYSDWRLPADMVGTAGVHVMLVVVVIVAASVFKGVVATRGGDPRLFYFAIALASIGVVILFFARLPLYREKRFFTFGPKALHGIHRKLYWISYLFLVPSVFLLAVLVAALK